MKAAPQEYAAWIAANEASPSDHQRQRAAAARFVHRPLISIILPVYKVPLSYLKRTIDSLLAQTYPHWEACIAFADPENETNWRSLQIQAAQDPRIRLLELDQNEGISANSNAALAIAKGEFVALLDHDDELSPSALFRMVEAIEAEPNADFLYSDKDCIDAQSTLRQRPLFKPCWSPEMLFSVNYLTHLNVMRRSVVEAVGGFRSQTDGAQDWDIFLRVCWQSRAIVRVPDVQYHWRLHEASTSLAGVTAKPYASGGQLQALQEHVARLGLPATLVPHPDSNFHLRWNLPSFVTIHLIVDATDQGGPRDETALPGQSPCEAILRRVQESLSTIEGCKSSATILVDEVDSPATAKFPTGWEVLACCNDTKARVVNQALARHMAATDALVFVSGRVDSLTEGWLEEMVGWVTCHPGVGFSSGLILDAAGNVVEAGLVLDREGHGSPLFRGIPPHQWGWFGGPLWYRNTTAVSPWLAAISAESYLSAGGFDEHLPWQRSFPSLCKAIGSSGKRGLVDPHARATLTAGELPAVPAFDESLKHDPYFHPAFCSVVPLKLGKNSQASATSGALHDGEQVLIVGGMHRSGTSLLASLCEGAGVSMGDRLLGVGGGGNPKGHYEDCDFLEFHQQALLANGLNPAGYTTQDTIHVPEAMLDRAQSLIASRSGPDRLWGWKDPRTVLFLDFWHTILPNAKYLFVFRSPWEVIESFFRRGDGEFICNPSLAVSVWLHYNRLIVDFVKRHPSQCVLKELSQAVDDPASVFQEMRDRLHVPIGPPSDRYEEGLLHRAGFAWRSTIVREYAPDAYNLYLEMQNMTGSRATLPDVAAATGQSLTHNNSQVFEQWSQTSRTEMRAQQLESHEKELTAQFVDSEQQRESLAERLKQVAASHEQSLAAFGRLSNQLDILAHQVASSSSEMAQMAGIVGPAAALPPASVWLHDSDAMHTTHPLLGIVEAKASALSSQLQVSEDLIGQLKKQAAKGSKTFVKRMEQESRRLYGQIRTVLKKVEREILRVKRKASA